METRSELRIVYLLSNRESAASRFLPFELWSSRVRARSFISALQKILRIRGTTETRNRVAGFLFSVKQDTNEQPRFVGCGAVVSDRLCAF